MSSNKDPAKNFKDNAGNYGEKHQEKFHLHVNKLASRELINEWKRNVSITSAICIWNYWIGDSSALYLFIPLVTLCLIPKVIDSFSVKYSLLINRYGSLYVDLVLIYAAFSMSFYSGWVAKYKILEVIDGPIQALLILFGWFSHKSTKKALLVRNIIIILVCAGTVSVLEFEFSMKIVGQYLIGGILLVTIGESSRKQLLKDYYGSYLHRSRNDHYQQEMQKSYYPHQLAAMKLKEVLEDTMKTEPGVGTVQEVDIIGSSEIEDERFPDLKQKAFKAMYNEGVRDYQINERDLAYPLGSCYKFKEMGDGFYNTFGYPFRFPDDSEGAMGRKVFEHSLRMLELWDEVFEGTGITAHLAITLGRNMLHGFWTHPPGVVFDIHQKGITKTARVSSTRRKLQAELPELLDCHLIIAEPEAMKDMPDDIVKMFDKIDLSSLDLNVRGFDQIKTLYVYPVRNVKVSSTSA